MTSTELRLLLTSWELSLRAERKSPQTLKSYGDGVRGYLRWAESTGREADLSRAQVRAFVTHLLDSGAAASTARSRQLALRRLSAWLTEEGEIDEDRLLGLKPPKLGQQVIEPLTDDELKAMLKACAGKDRRDRRGEGGKGRSVPVGPQTAQAIDRYIRVRRAHRLTETPAL